MKSKAAIFYAFLLVVLVSAVAAEWSARTTGITQNLNAIFFPTKALGFAAGDGVVIKTTDGSQSWATIPGLSGTYHDVFCPSPTESYVLGVQAGSGVVLKSTDASSFSEMIFTGVRATSYLKGSCLGNFRAIVGTLEGGTNSVLLFSTDGGTSWTSRELTDFNVGGVFLGPGASGDSTTCLRWVWGKQVSNNANVIMINETQQFVDSPVRDLFATSPLVVYAALSDDRVIKSSDGGASWTTFYLSGASGKMNALYFVTDNFGWVAGKGGYVSFTADGGSTWNNYTLSSPYDINDLNVSLAGLSSAGIGAASIRVNAATLAQVYAFMAGSGGNVSQLESPKITGIAPAAMTQGMIATAEISGVGFLDGAQVSIEAAGVITASSSFESATDLQAQLLIKGSATPGIYNLLVTNPDATASREIGAFSVNAGSAAVNFSNIWLDLSKYLSPEVSNVPKSTINNLPFVSFEVNSNNGMTPATVMAQIIGHYPIGTDEGTYIFSPIIPASGITVLSPTKLNIHYQFSGTAETLPAGQIIDFLLYGEDSAGNAGTLYLLTSVAGGTTPPPWASPANPNGGVVLVLPKQNTWDPETATTLPVVAQFTPGISVKAFTMKIVDFKGRQIYTRDFSYGANGPSAADVRVSQTPTSNGFVTKFNFNITAQELAPALSPGIYLVLFYDKSSGSTGNLLGKSTLQIAPSIMH